MLKKIVLSICSSISVLLFIGCSNEVTIQPLDVQQETTGKTYFVTEEMAKQIAQTTVETQNRPDGWTASSKVISVFPIYMSGIEGVSYWECKVETNGSPSGYVLVTSNKTDVLVPELSQTGLTLTEQYRMKNGTNDLAIHRYDWSHSAAFTGSGNSGLSKRSSKPVETIGFDDEFNNHSKLAKSSLDSNVATFDSYDTKYSESTQLLGCMPRYSKKELEEYYNELVAPTDGLAKTSADREERAELKNYCLTPTNSAWHTAQWNQYKKADGYSIGCGPVAWAIVYAYYDSFKGLNKLFGATNAYSVSYQGGESNADIKSAMATIAGIVGTFNVSNGSGMTWPTNMQLGFAYGYSVGYSASSCTQRYGTEYSKFDHAKTSLNEDRPCILSINADGIGIVDHYVVIEAARETSTKYLWVWHDRNVYYTVNYGWGNTRKEICVRDWGSNQNDVHTANSLYDIWVK